MYNKCKDKNILTCAQFYEEKIRSMLEIFSEVIGVLTSIEIENKKSIEKCIRIHDN